MTSDNKKECVESHILAIRIINQREVPFTIYEDNTVKWDHICCNKCGYEFHHVTYGYVCEDCSNYYLCFNCHEPEYEFLNEKLLISWYLNTETKYTSITLKSSNMSVHQSFVSDHKEKHVSAEFEYFKFNMIMTTHLKQYFKFLITGIIPQDYQIKWQIPR
jgi:hypothetical protein